MLRFSYQSPDGSVVRFRARSRSRMPNNDNNEDNDIPPPVSTTTTTSSPPLVRKHTRFGLRVGSKTTTLEEVNRIPVSRTGWLASIPRDTVG
jgi:hypothetical protein